MNISGQTRIEPYKNCKLRLWTEGRYVYGGGQPADFRPGVGPFAPLKSPGRSKYETVTLERGVTHDPAFQNWASRVSGWGSALGAEVPPESFRKTIYLEFYNETGQLVTSYQLYRCWVSKYKALPALGGNANAVAIEHIHLAYEGLVLAPAPHRHSH